MSSNFSFTVINDFFTDYECDYIISLADEKMTRSKVGTAGDSKVCPQRTSSQMWLPHEHTKITYDLAHRVSEQVGIPYANLEQLQLCNYKETQEYQPHYDSHEADTPERIKAAAGWGQRLKTAMVYLNDVEEGGTTVFPRLGIEIPPKKGRLLIFNNIDEKKPNYPLYDSFHGGSPVIKGSKWVCNFWFHQHSASLRHRAQ